MHNFVTYLGIFYVYPSTSLQQLQTLQNLGLELISGVLFQKLYYIYSFIYLLSLLIFINILNSQAVTSLKGFFNSDLASKAQTKT